MFKILIFTLSRLCTFTHSHLKSENIGNFVSRNIGGFVMSSEPKIIGDKWIQPHIFETSSTVVSIKDKLVYKNDETYHEKRDVITLSPGGYRGFYMFGVCKFIKTFYTLDNFVFSGASAGSWLSLFLSFRGNINEIENYLIDNHFQTVKSIHNMERILKYKLLRRYDTTFFDLKKVYIGVTTLNCSYPKTCIFTNFYNLEDAINCCIASSHIPIVTGGLSCLYQNVYSFDGGFSKYPYLNTVEPKLHITPFLWNSDIHNQESSTAIGRINKVYNAVNINTYTSLLVRGKISYYELIEHGFMDCLENKKQLDELFIKNVN